MVPPWCGRQLSQITNVDQIGHVIVRGRLEAISFQLLREIIFLILSAFDVVDQDISAAFVKIKIGGV